ncbi:DASH complex subunit dad1 [Schizosaccharomyces pombe]|uniref:DASH complex subunit dad1 n=1 Tax=Schizosaccharomyces pombe (strain 972 / ATCC 24843) TaxID=284812 RepID=DAD1_SCHPO|nr:DASH complex subunit Dad1 [Schizosaccharomyces pombe]P87297.2 RecName: Full=DASH complex subunit dad1; AltName: Full=Outer kinetochore protein dad1 [Schizosaccharomyces pombe 972h-]CAB09998.2 DASH complex subunit Dad1 [Schizosaccharomyces pombe]|eukprot:NP_594045.2 DASH complex subunit Dad1 [Schizosaccharomyces pombe]
MSSENMDITENIQNEQNKDFDDIDFERRRRLLTLQISKSMNEVVNLMSALNKNLESINGVGKEFENVASLWKEFQNSVLQKKDREMLDAP